MDDDASAQSSAPGASDVVTAVADPPTPATVVAATASVAAILATVKGAVSKAVAPECPTMELFLRESSAGGSGAFLIRADDQKPYWCKVIENGQSPRVPVNEQIVGRVGAHIGAAVCPVSLIRIPTDFDGFDFSPGRKLKAGFAHGSLAVEPAIEMRKVGHPYDDNNPKRLASLAVLADWCWPSDAQWLSCPPNDNQYWSHDHGYYFPGGPNWTKGSLMADNPNQKPPFPIAITNPTLAADVLAKLASLDVMAIASLLSGLPQAWPVDEEELVAMAFFLEQRRVAVLGRLAPASPTKETA